MCIWLFGTYLLVRIVSPNLFTAGQQLHRSETSLPYAIYLASRLVESAEGEDFQPLPTRLLDVRSPSGKVRLVEPGDGSTGRYATLSHRWGTLTGHVTTKENLAERLQELNVRNLPELFIDAIRVCRDTGLRYLWIDSLCILQNSPEDWKRESKLMGNIYAQSTFTIAAHSAKTDQESFLENSAARFKFVSLQGTDKKLWNIRLPRNFEREMACDSSINSRGWVLQERLLSKRILHFLPSAIYLETDKGVQEMDSAKGFNSNGSPRVIQYQPYGFERLQLMSAFDRFNPSDHWQSIVEAYSNCQLTNDRDKLPALAGIANRIQKKDRYDYIAGLWLNENFLPQLLWFASDGTSTKRPKSHRAPSLSWASVDGPVKHLFESPSRRRRMAHSSRRTGGELVPAGLNHMDNEGFDPADLINGPDRNHLQATLEYQNKEEPYWIDRDVPLLFEGALVQLPKLGSRWSPTSRTVGNGKIWFRITQQFKAVEGIHCCRPLLLGDDVVGIVILDEDSDDRSPEIALWCLSAATGRDVIVLLVVSENREQQGTYRRVGLCLVVRYIHTGDGCSFTGEPSFLTGLRGKKRPILFT